MYCLQLSYHEGIGVFWHLAEEIVDGAIDEVFDLKLPEVGLDISGKIRR